MDGWDMFNVGRSTQWAFAGGAGFNPKADSATIGLAILILRQMASPTLCQSTPKGIIDRKSWRTLHPRLILHVPGAIRVHGG